jgi:hypothetical protein
MKWGTQGCGLVLCMGHPPSWVTRQMDQEVLFATELKIDAGRIFEVVLISGVRGSANFKAG